MNPSRPNTVRLQRIARAYRETGALLAAVELDLFSKISEGANTEGTEASEAESSDKKTEGEKTDKAKEDKAPAEKK